jgi:glycosyltransferase involved in cell wall biosynthesis
MSSEPKIPGRVWPRVAYFPDSFHEVNGVAHTSRNFAAFAKRHGMPMLVVRAGAPPSPGKRSKTRRVPPDGSVEALELGRSPLAVQMERDLQFDPLFFRYSGLISQTVRDFRPEIIHITGPSELGIFGAYFAWKLNVPLVASWHTNVHEYAARRMNWLTRNVSKSVGSRLEHMVERATLKAVARFYHVPSVLYAPNPELCAMLETAVGKPFRLMQRGVETDIFTPARRTRTADDKRLVLGFVGRLSVEKNVALLPKIDSELRARGIEASWLIVGHGAEDAMLKAALHNVDMAGVLRGQALAEAYANMDLFIFPSHTDTFGNVVLEALASGVPAIVTPDGGPASIVRDGETGRVAKDEAFAAAVAQTLADPERFAAMRAAARRHAMQCSWDAVFQRVVDAYPVAQHLHTDSLKD